MIAQNSDADMVVLNEILTLDSFSHFRRTYKASATTEAKIICQELLGGMVRRFGREGVIVTSSNHDARFVKWIVDKGGEYEDACELWRTLLDSFTQTSKPTFLAGIRVQIGHALFSHPDSYYKTQGESARREGVRCKANYAIYGLVPPFDIVVVGHPHRLNFTQWEGERGFLVEAGCQCYVPRYVVEDWSTKLCTQFPMTNGYASVVLDKQGRVDFKSRETRVAFLGWATLPQIAKQQEE
jgi:hypothetical protein